MTAIKQVRRTTAADPKQALRPWLQGLRAQHQALREREATPLHLIQRWSDLPPGQPLFETLAALLKTLP